MNIQVCESGYVYYMAVDADSYDGAPDSKNVSGHGLTPYAAVQDLRDSYEVSEDDEGIMACDIWLMAHRDENDNTAH